MEENKQLTDLALPDASWRRGQKAKAAAGGRV